MTHCLSSWTFVAFLEDHLSGKPKVGLSFFEGNQRGAAGWFPVCTPQQLNMEPKNDL